MIFKKEYKLGIALGGGSAKGLAHIGVLKVLNEEGIKIHSISGTSIGSIVGGIYALKPEIENLLSESKRLINSNAFKELRFDKFSRNEGGWFGRIKSRFRDGLTIADALMKKSLIPEETFEKIFKEIFDDYDVRDAIIPFSCIAVDLISGEDIIFDKGPLYKLAMASSSIPGVFPPVKYKDYILVDGGVTSNVPIEGARKLGAEKVIGVVVSGNLKGQGNFSKAIEVILRSDEIAKFKLFRTTLKEADFLLEIDLSEFHWADFSRIDELISRGEEATRKELKNIKELLKGKTLWERILKK